MNNFLYYLYYVAGRFRKTYFMAIPENKEEFKRSRVFFTIDGATAQVILQLSAGVFIAALIGNLGISDSLNGTISAFSVLACIAQPIAVMVTANLKKLKLFVCFTAITHRLLFAFIFFIPFLNMSNQGKIILFSFCFMAAHIFMQMGSPAANDWIATLIHPKLRGRYFAIRDLVAVIALSVAMLFSATMMDYFEKHGSILMGFLVVGVVILLATVINLIALSNIKEPKMDIIDDKGRELHGSLLKKAKQKDKTVNKTNIFREILYVISDKKTSKILILQILWQFAFFSSCTYNSIYQIKELALPYTYIMVVALFMNLIRVFITPIWGKMGDKYGMARVLKYAFMFYVVAQIVFVFTVPQNGYIMICISMLFSSIAWGFIGIGMLGVQLDYMPNDKRTTILSINAAIGGVVGFFASFLGGVILDSVQKSNLTFLGNHVYGQQILNLITIVVLIVMIIYIKLRLQNVEKIVNTSDGNVKI